MIVAPGEVGGQGEGLDVGFLIVGEEQPAAVAHPAVEYGLVPADHSRKEKPANPSLGNVARGADGDARLFQQQVGSANALGRDVNGGAGLTGQGRFADEENEQKQHHDGHRRDGPPERGRRGTRIGWCGHGHPCCRKVS